ncbi:MAG TPA: T9SS type A sorting domain-containing protein, partial [Chitinophagales bacterium]|nr:T9SS type A sorting domain-containing protein [Chitinophagales bacterium]
TLVSVGLANTDAASVVKLFPNPATNAVQLQIGLTQSDDLNLQLADVTGKLVMEQYLGEVNDKTFTLNLSTIASGVYYIRISGNNVNTVQRLVIEK